MEDISNFDEIKEQKNLKGSVASGVRWSLCSQFVRQMMQWVTIAILARLLLPSDFGLVGMAMVVIGFLVLFKDLGTSSSVIQKSDPSEKLLSSVFWVNVILGVLATVFIFLLAPLFAIAFNEPKVEVVLKILSLNFVISGFSILQQALYQKKMAFRVLAWIEICSVFLGSILGIVLALLEMGVFSLVFQSILTSLVATFLFWIFGDWKPKLYLGFFELKQITKYSLNLTGFNVINYFLRNADSILIGRFLGAEQLGFYSLAYRIMLYPLQNISMVLGRVMFPAYSQIQNDDAKIRNLYLRVAGAIAFIAFPMMLGLMAISKPFVLTMFGAKWETLIYLLIILSPVGMIQSITTTTGSIYLAKGKTDWMMWWGIGAGLVIINAFIIGLNWGVVGVAVSYAVATILLTYPCLVIPFRLINLRIHNLWREIYKPLMISGLMFVILLFCSFFFDSQNSFTLISCIFIGIGIYLSVSWRTNREQTREFLYFAKSR